MKYATILLFSFFQIIVGCSDNAHNFNIVYHSQGIRYDKMVLSPSTDTIQFDLEENVYNEIKSFNLFQGTKGPFICFYDHRSESIVIYYLATQKFYKRISLSKLLPNRQLYKTSVFIKNWDSIFVLNKFNLYLFDSSGLRKKIIKLPDEPSNAFAVFDSDKQPILIGNKLFTLIRPYVDYKSLRAIRSWQIIFDFDLHKKKAALHYYLPEIYQKKLYGYYYLDYNFCFNNQDKFVFSFAADTLLYETDLKSYHHAFFAKSKYQTTAIQEVKKEALDIESSLKQFSTQYSYGSVYFDPVRKYYLRQVRHKISSEELSARKTPRRTVLIFNDNFQIIGESDWPDTIDFNSLLITPDGALYARVNSRNENALQFIKLNYQDLTAITLHSN